MIEILEEEEKPVRAFLVGSKKLREPENTLHFNTSTSNANGLNLSHKQKNKNSQQAELLNSNRIITPKQNTKEELQELFGLVKTLGMEICDYIVLPNHEPQPKFGIGTGKAQTIVNEAKQKNADCIIFDFEISPTHQRNWEKFAKIPVFDRNEVILRIFAGRARTKEAKLQVNLAKLQYSLPRLAHSYGDMAKQRGGNYGSKGFGETKLELDRRTIQNRISSTKAELEKVVKERKTTRARRDKVPLPSCALVGYTNAGKSSLLNALTGADVFVEDKLFATLDPTTRRLTFDGNNGILLTDTVGFISNLPHNLINAFKSTLEEAALADLQILVLDASDPNIFEQYQTVLQVLKEINAQDIQRIIVLNKIDCVKDMFSLHKLENSFPKAIKVSAVEKIGFEDLIFSIRKILFGEQKTYFLPLEKYELLDIIRKTGILLKNEWNDNFILVEAQIPNKTHALLAPYEKHLQGATSKS
ncbi:MAG: GTPase HflX [Treponema sp.]|jgi:GTP-binding protein HflX|nr:GTPase HflX [Treponema sp.]